ncbi:hypothetical protein KY309_02420 [Candidatus Woesearchaeota archaeon]|nr:hypothetical protein [Candidatus Woesearchaeota archaeon]MBW3016441.1 hypothetical protein [Candidatus Woesearchaeota archaeon]
MLFQYGAYGGRNFWQLLVDYGLIDALLPFLLIFVVVFAILQRLQLFAEPEVQGQPRRTNRGINGIIGMLIGAMVVVPHIVGLYPATSDPVILINRFLPHTAVILIAIFCVMLLIGLPGGAIPSPFLTLIALGALGILGFVILMAVIPGFWPAFGFLRDPAVQAFLIIIIVFALVVYFALIREPEDGGGFQDWYNRWWLGPPPA